ncbi:MAG: hypothetical protein E7773_04670 [Sphingomonas sp.]|uniref:hypothetical protein n=1 Tax=Sphingomonas sp. TaxID=28214 RepID=UPI001201CB59|nr:hypothetical protein [Sphingomonas sp.]THD37325.1 MAG: hypothetical protein E7773_04670 [Sphingomonas sp.]
MPEQEHIFQAQRAWAEKSLFTLRSFLPLMAPVGGYAWGNAERRTIGELASATARASESALLLCAYGQLWDAEVLVRSVLEGTLKFAYLLQSHETFAVRHREYSQDLFELALLKDHQKAVSLLAATSDPDAPDWQPIRDRLLPDDERDQLKQSMTPAARRDLERRWGFTGLVGELERSNDPLFRHIGATAFAYAMASHIQHVDAIGSSIPLERDLRGEERRETIQMAHVGRLAGDPLRFMFLRLAVGYRFTGADRSPLVEVKAAIDREAAQFQQAYREWMTTEYPDADFYTGPSPE